MSSGDEGATDVKFLSHRGRYAEGGSIQLMFSNDADATYTQKTTTYQNQRCKFLQQLVTYGFDQLKESTADDGSSKWSFAATVPGPNSGDQSVHFEFNIVQSEVLKGVTFTPCSGEDEKNQFARDHNITPGDTTILINGIEYFVNMNFPLHFLYMGNPDIIFDFGVFVIANTSFSAAIASVVSTLGIDAFSKAFAGIEGDAFKGVWSIAKGIVQAGYRFTSGLTKSLLAGESAADAVTAAVDLAGEAWATAVSELTVSVLAYSVIGIIVMAAVFAFISFIFEQSYQKVFVYNLTEMDVEITFPYVAEGAIYNTSSDIGDIKRVFLPAPSNDSSGDYDVGKYYNASTFTVQSNSVTNGIGYTIRIDVKNPGTEKVLQTFSALYDIPMNVKNNSLLCKSFDPIQKGYSSWEDWYKKAGHEFNTYWYTWDDSHWHGMSVSYDYLSGKHPDPETKSDQHLFNSIIYIGPTVN